MKKALSTLFACICLLATFALAHAQTAVQQKIETFTGNKQTISSELHNQLSHQFKAYAVYKLDVNALDEHIRSSNYPGKFNLNLGTDYAWKLHVWAQDIRNENVTVRVGTQNGVINETPIHNTTFRGFLNANSGGDVRLSIDQNWLFGFVGTGNKDIYLEPLKRFDATAPANYFLVYANTDVIDTGEHRCGADEVMAKVKEMQNSNPEENINNPNNPDTPAPISPNPDNKDNCKAPHSQGFSNEIPGVNDNTEASYKLNTITGSYICRKLECAVASDYSMFVRYSSTANIQTYLNAIYNAAEANYTSLNVDIDFVTVTYYHATTSTDPFQTNVSTDAVAYLYNFRSWGNGGGFGATVYDFGSCWTAVNISGGVVGIAFLDAICNDYRYQLNEDFTGYTGVPPSPAALSNLRVVVAHETGHNFGMWHNNPATDEIMEPYVNTNATQFYSVSQHYYNAYTSGIACLSGCNCIEVTQAKPISCNAAGTTYSLQLTIEHNTPSGTFTATAGSASATFAFGSNPQTVTLTGVPTATTSVTVTDNVNPCTNTVTYLLPTQPTFTGVPASALCFGNNTPITITASPSEQFGSINIVLDGDEYSNDEQSAEIRAVSGEVIKTFPRGSFANNGITTVSSGTINKALGPFTVLVFDSNGDGMGNASGCSGITNPASYSITDGLGNTLVGSTNLAGVTCSGNNAIQQSHVVTPGTTTTLSGNYTGTGINNGTANDGIAVFDPAIAGVGTHTISYTYNADLGCTSKQFTITIAAPTPAPTAVGAQRCGPGNVSLSAIGCGTGQVVRWYTAPTGGTPIYTGNPYTVFLNNTTTYYASCYDPTSGCESGRAAVTGTVNLIPNPPTAVNASRCGPGNLTLSANGCGTGTIARWYTTQTGGSPFYTGSSYSVYLNNTTTYWVSCYNTTTGCESTRTAVTGTIKIDLVVTQVLGGGGNQTVDFYTMVFKCKPANYDFTITGGPVTTVKGSKVLTVMHNCNNYSVTITGCGCSYSFNGGTTCKDDNFTPTDFVVDFYPNPVDNLMVVNANIPLTQIRIYDLKGRMYLNQPVDNEPQSEINTSTLPEGMYFIETRAINGTVEVKKLVVSH